MKIAKESSLEMYQMPNGNYGVLINGNLYAKIVNCGLGSNGQGLGWQTMSQTSAHKNGRNRYPTPEAAAKSYFGRKAVVISPSDIGEIA
jgi:hypothetical protein